MKWLKHMTASWDDEGIARLVSEGGEVGLARYGLWWRVLEIVARQMEGPSPSCSVCYPISVWSHLLVTRGSLVFSTLSRLAVTGGVTVERHGSDIRVTIPNLLKYRDEYSKKSGHTPDTVRTRTEGAGEGDTHTEKKGVCVPVLPQKPEEQKTRIGAGDDSLPLWLDRESWAGFLEMRKKIKKPMTDKAAKIAIGKLERWRAEGYDPTMVLNEAIMNNWQGLWIPKGPDGKPIQPVKQKAKVIPLDPNNPDDWIRASFDPETGRSFDPADPADRARCTFNAATNQWGAGG